MSKLADAIAYAMDQDTSVVDMIYDYYEMKDNPISWDGAQRLRDWYTKFRPPCSACVATFGKENAMLADIAHHSNLIADEWVFLCADHAVERGYINDFGSPTGRIVKLLHDPRDVEYVRDSIRRKEIKRDD
jgi:hypothetical protein